MTATAYSHIEGHETWDMRHGSMGSLCGIRAHVWSREYSISFARHMLRGIRKLTEGGSD